MILDQEPAKPVRDAFLSVCLHPSMYLYTYGYTVHTHAAMLLLAEGICPALIEHQHVLGESGAV